MASSAENFNIVIELTEEDIPGASLASKIPSELKMDELRFWLKCRGDSCKGLKTKAQFVKRVDEYIKSGRDKSIVDPDENKIFSKRKARKHNLLTSHEIQPNTNKLENTFTDPVIYPKSGWSTSLSRMPFFTRAEMNLHISKSGKSFDPKSKHHTVPTCMRRAKTFLDDEYLKEVLATSDNKHFYFKCLCYHSFKKNDPPHKLTVALNIVSGEVKNAECSCVAGKIGFCNHVLALMMKICKFCLYDCKDVSELDRDDDMLPTEACTSSLQTWHRRGRGDSIQPQPVMEINVKKSKLDCDTSSSSAGESSHKKSGVQCNLYEARTNLRTQENDELNLKQALKQLNPLTALAQIMNDVGDQDSYVETLYGKSPRGSYGSYQLSLTESNFKVFCDINSVSRKLVNDKENINTTIYPSFPITDRPDFECPKSCIQSEKKFMEQLCITTDKLNDIERKTRAQYKSAEWSCERKYRLTASNFGLITKRKRNHDSLVNNLLNPKHFNSKYTAHGNKFESTALQQYQKYMHAIGKPIMVFKSGFVVCKDAPFLGASPDGKVVDGGCSEPYGLVEVKCPETKYRVTPLDACLDPKFCSHEIDGKPQLKRDHDYYAQVQGQLGVTQAKWCDFVIYTDKGLSIERIKYDHQYWINMKNRLQSFYFAHFINLATNEYFKNS